MIILVCGLPGSGKSYLAERLAKKCGAVYLSSDIVRQEMNARGHYSREDKLNVYKELQKQAAALCRQEKDVVVDATFFHHTLREMFLSLAKEIRVRIYVIEVTASEDLIRKRLKEPRPFSEADFKVYESVRDVFEEITMPHLVLESTNDNIDFMLDSAIEYLGI